MSTEYLKPLAALLSTLESLPLQPADDYPADHLQVYLQLSGIATISAGHYGAVVSLTSKHVVKLCLGERDGYPAYAQWAERNPGRHIVRVFASGWIGPLFWCVLPTLLELDDTDCARLNSPGHRWRTTVSRLQHLFQDFRWDMHNGNVMYDPEEMDYVITDPVAACRGDDVSARDRSMYRVLEVDQIVDQHVLDFDAAPAEEVRPVVEHAARRPVPESDSPTMLGGWCYILGADTHVDWHLYEEDVVLVVRDAASMTWIPYTAAELQAREMRLVRKAWGQGVWRPGVNPEEVCSG